MALVTRKIKRQIQSVRNIKKITKAMELVSTAKMKKAVKAVLASRPYTQLAWQVVLNLAARTDPRFHPLLQKREEIKKIGLVLLSSNRGLCGVFNQQIIRQALSYLYLEQEKTKPETIEFITLGRKGAKAIIKAGYPIAADFPKVDIVTNISEIRPISQLVVKDYLAEKYDKVVLIYTDFISSLKQKPQVKQLLPLVPEWEVGLGEVGKEISAMKIEKEKWYYEYLFEPTPDFILKEFLPRLIEIQIYQAISESNASEHSARMMAMKNASEAALDLISDLTLAFNKARQAGITKEITEITVSKAALEE